MKNYNSNDKKANILIISGIVLAVLIIAIIFIFYSGKTKKIKGVVTNEDEMYEIIIDSALHHKTMLKMETSFYVADIDFNKVINVLLDKNRYIASELYGYSFKVDTLKNGNYRIIINMKDTSYYRSFLIEKKVKSLAKDVERLNDYEAIKAVHDYLILTNEYVNGKRGAYSALYKSKTSCTGYAYSFYLIMTELEIPVTIESSPTHVWNRVFVDGKWYNIDITWDDLGKDKVSYDYFLKCDNDWKGHPHGGATAQESHEVTGRSPQDNKKMFRNYNSKIVVFVIIIIIIIGFIYLKVDRWGKEKDKEREYREKYESKLHEEKMKNSINDDVSGEPELDFLKNVNKAETLSDLEVQSEVQLNTEVQNNSNNYNM